MSSGTPGPSGPSGSRGVLRLLGAEGRTIVLGLAVAVVYAVPQLLYWARGGEGLLFLQGDEPAYAARLVRAVQGDGAVGNPWLIEHAGDPTIIPSLPEHVLAAPARAWARITGGHPDPQRVALIWRLILPLAAFLSVQGAFRASGLGRDLALLAAVLACCDAGGFGYKPGGASLFGARFLSLNRFSNPLFPLVTFFLAWAAWARALGDDRRATAVGWAVAAGVLAGLHFYVSIFYWTHLGAAAVVAALIVGGARRRRRMALALAVAAAVAVPYAVMLARLRTHPVYPVIAWRNGLMLADRGWYLLGHKALWLFVLAALPLARSPRVGERLLLAGILGGLGCYASSLATGRSLQNFHWHYTLMPLLYAGALAGLLPLIRRLGPLRSGRVRSAAVLVVAVLALGDATLASARTFADAAATTRWGTGLTDRPYARAWRWLRAHARAGDVVLADPRTIEVIPTRTGLYVWMSPHLVVDLVPFEEILRRNQVSWALAGLDRDDLVRELTPRAEVSVPTWIHGLTPGQVAALEAEGRPIFDRALDARLARELADTQALLTAAEVVARGRRYRLDYLVRGPNERRWRGPVEALLELEPVGYFGEARIDRVIGWRDPDREPRP
jgi:hypothetical protein